MKSRLLFLLVPALVTCALHLLADVAWGWAALAAFVGWPVIGTLVTVDDDLPGGWSNPDGKQRPDWLTAFYWAHMARNGAIAGSIAAVDAATRSKAPLVLWITAAVTAGMAIALHRYIALQDDAPTPDAAQQGAATDEARHR